jgi:hypothetical protein
MRLTHLSVGILVACVSALASAQNLRAPQSRTIQIIDSATREPVAGAEIHAVRSKSSQITPKTGVLRLESFFKGDTLSVRRVGYHPIFVAAEAIPEDQPVVTIGLVPIPRILADVTIDARISTILKGVGFYDRRNRLSGFFVDPAQMAEMHPSRTSDIFERAMGARLSPAALGGRVVRFSRARDCAPTVYVDGVVMLAEPAVNLMPNLRTSAERTSETRTDIYGQNDHGIDEVGVRQIAAVEAYATGVQAPPEFNHTGGNCGIILLWTWNNVRH